MRLLSKSLLTFLVNTVLLIYAITMANIIDLMLVMPTIAVLGTALLHIKKPLLPKLLGILIIVINTYIILLISISLLVSWHPDQYIYPGIIAGIAGVAFWGNNALFTDVFKMTIKSQLIVFFCAGLSYPLYTLIVEVIYPNHNNVHLLRDYSLLFLWFTFTNIGISLTMKNKEKIDQ